ncbi:MAG: PmoA family protein [Isosphaeraceae bacterium]|nr:PmoA family protein [Isosphaeraceae bacterium]
MFRMVLCGALALLLASPSTLLAKDWRVMIQGASADLGETPLVVELKTIKPPVGSYTLRLANEAGLVPARVFEDDGKTYIGFVLPQLKARHLATGRLEGPSPGASGDSGIGLHREGANVRVTLDGQAFTEYIADFPSKPYYFPVLGPTGAPFTRAYPMKQVEGEDKDHPHQRSFWFTHGDVNGYDFWASDPLNRPNPKFGTIKETAKKSLIEGPVGLIRTTDDWLGPDGKKVCEDERVVRFYATREVRIIDVDVTIKATAGPVTFGDTKEGMFGLRIASSMDVKRKQGGRIINAEGITDTAAWGKPSKWVDYTGPVAGQIVGIAILNHPDSFRYPTTWHVRDYGLFAANPFGWHDFGLKRSGTYTLPEGQSITFRYRVLLHKGATESARLAEAFEAYASPPQVEIQAD